MPSRFPGRIAVRGQNLTFPDGSAARLRGFNLLFELDTPFELPRDDTDVLLKTLLPQTNVVRLVMVHWDDSPTENAGPSNENDCSETQHFGRAIRQRCLEQFDDVLRWTASQGLWAIITARASIAAGEDTPENPHGKGDTFFNDPVLRDNFRKTWEAIANRYKTFDMIAGYEVLSEPRVQPSVVPPERVRGFYEELVTAVQAIDARTPVLIGPAPFYSRSNLPDVILPSKRNIIYMFNFFVPRQYVQKLDNGLSYPGEMPCCYLHDKDHRKCCPMEAKGVDLSKQPCCAAPVMINRAALQVALEEPLRIGREYGVPVLLDQWGVQRGVAGRIEYLRDMLSLLDEHGMHWTYWQWRHKSDRPFAILYKDNPHDAHEPHVDLAALTEFAKVLAINDAEAAAAFKPYKDAECYVKHYPELLKKFCGGDIEMCPWQALWTHWRDHGSKENRAFSCDDATQCEDWCADNPQPWEVKCKTFWRCRGCESCHPRPPILPRPSPPPPPQLPAPAPPPPPKPPSPSPLPARPLSPAKPKPPPPPNPLPPAPIITSRGHAVVSTSQSQPAKVASVLNVFMGDGSSAAPVPGHLDEQGDAPPSISASLTMAMAAAIATLALILWFWRRLSYQNGRGALPKALRRPHCGGGDSEGGGRRRMPPSAAYPQRGSASRSGGKPPRASRISDLRAGPAAAARYERVALDVDPVHELQLDMD